MGADSGKRFIYIMTNYSAYDFSQSFQPPLVLPRWGDAGYYVTVKDWLTKVTLVTDKPLIISWLQTTIRQAMVSVPPQRGRLGGG